MSHCRRALLALAPLAVLAGCGGTGQSTSFSAAHVPLVPGVHVIHQYRQCDRGANAFCRLELVVVDRRLSSSGDLITRERRLLKARGWSDASGDFGRQQAADSPGHKLHVTYATALADLTGIDEEWIKRSPALALVLSQTVFSRTPAMSLTLTKGPS